MTTIDPATGLRVTRELRQQEIADLLAELFGNRIEAYAVLGILAAAGYEITESSQS